MTSEILEHSILPADLAAVVDKGELVRMVYEALDRTDWPRSSNDPGELVLRSLLVYALATGKYSSAEIESAAAHDLTFRYIASSYRPEWKAICEYRRKNRSELKQSLTTLLALACAGAHSLPALEREAELRLQRSARSDSMWLDD